MPPRRELRVRTPSPLQSSSASAQEVDTSQRGEAREGSVPPAPQMPRSSYEVSKAKTFGGTASDPIQAAEWISEMENIFEVMDISEEHKVICATFQFPTYAEVLEKAQIIELDKRKEIAATGKFLGKRPMESKGNASNKKFKKSFDICYDKPQCPKWVCYRCGEKGHMAKDCTAPQKGTVGQQGGNKEQAKGAAGQRQRGNARVFAVTTEDVEGGPNVVAGKIYNIYYVNLKCYKHVRKENIRYIWLYCFLILCSLKLRGSTCQDILIEISSRRYTSYLTIVLLFQAMLH
ncbi:hypothetical protein NE237_006455 [Protea cynaroides]|uniref:CCHC-type domain-containing protein n=1 Tax=Protea cynaroides TaxID=273540 RepID=A0A9Q0KN85_9MAGN|nr:hypothetical protein NE237_006455 [Protea cynaroides]